MERPSSKTTSVYMYIRKDQRTLKAQKIRNRSINKTDLLSQVGTIFSSPLETAKLKGLCSRMTVFSKETPGP